MNKFKEVSKYEYLKFIENYPEEKLTRDVNMIFDPAVISWNDLTIGTGFDMIMAWCNGERDGSYSNFHVKDQTE